MKHLCFFIFTLFYCCEIAAQSVYMHEAQEEAAESSSIGLDGLISVLILGGLIYLANAIFASKKSNSTKGSNFMSDYEKEDELYNDVLEENEELSELEAEELAEYLVTKDKKNSFDFSPIKISAPKCENKVKHPKYHPSTGNTFFDEIVCEEEERLFPNGSIEDALSDVEKNGYVDLGLSVKWCALNIGAKDVKEMGIYFRWGDINGIESYDINKIVEYSNIPYSTHIAKIKTDISGKMEFDPALNFSNGKGRLPTQKECEELMTQCVWKLVEVGEYKGYVITGKTGKSIFLPLYYHSYVNCMQQIMLSIAVSYHTGTPVTKSEYGSDECSNSLHIVKEARSNEYKISICETYKICHYPIRPVLNAQKEPFLSERL